MSVAKDKHDIPLGKWHVTLMSMISAVCEAFVAKGKADPDARADAEVAVEAIYMTFRGEQIYVPFSTSTQKAFLHSRIFAEFDGDNHEELCRRYGMSIQNVYRIIKKQREINRIERDKSND